MLTALPATRQHDGELTRAWYFSSSLDMFVWFGIDDMPCAFELAYKTRRQQDRVVAWHQERGYRHWRPEAERGRFSTSMLAQPGPLDCALVAAQFLAQCADLPAAIVNCVLIRLAAFEQPAELPPAHPHPGRRRSDARLAAASE